VANMSDDYLLTRAEIAAFKYGAHPVSCTVVVVAPVCKARGR
jgi:hypothetical protein